MKISGKVFAMRYALSMFVSSIAPMMRVDSLSLYAVSSILSFAVFLSLSWCIFYFIHCRHKVIFVTETSKYKKLTVFLLMTRQFWDYFELALKDAIMSNSLRAPLSYFYNFRKLHSLNLNSISIKDLDESSLTKIKVARKSIAKIENRFVYVFILQLRNTNKTFEAFPDLEEFCSM